ncbi:hypothetical protein N9L47_10655 [Rhodobacteraceae bacterium]|nr:hypothetical protein [Paracoccaceae bacterium]
MFSFDYEIDELGGLAGSALDEVTDPIVLAEHRLASAQKSGQMKLIAGYKLFDPSAADEDPFVECVSGPLCDFITSGQQTESFSIKLTGVVFGVPSNIWNFSDGELYWEDDFAFQGPFVHQFARGTVSNMTISEVPLPAGIVLLMSGLLLLRRFS